MEATWNSTAGSCELSEVASFAATAATMLMAQMMPMPSNVKPNPFKNALISFLPYCPTASMNIQSASSAKVPWKA